MSSRTTHSVGQTLWRRVSVAAAVAICVTILRILHWTWRKDLRQMARLDALQETGVPIIVGFWHGSYVPLFVLCRGRHAIVLIAPGIRGDIIAGICRAFGYRPLLLDGTAGNTARAHLKTALGTDAPTAAVAIDGPLGPLHTPKLGIQHLTGTLGYQIVPVSVSAWPRLVLSRRWDHMAVPLPFAKVVVHVGEPIHVPPHASATALQSVQQAICRAMDDSAAMRSIPLTA